MLHGTYALRSSQDNFIDYQVTRLTHAVMPETLQMDVDVLLPPIHCT